MRYFDDVSNIHDIIASVLWLNQPSMLNTILVHWPIVCVVSQTFVISMKAYK